ncbi:MAG: tyrosine-type recombinase/integrase [Rhodothermaceae bacterium]|nr:tyrosine-type recombinase/integrase [Rhodothermaceae bacterium]MYD66805.1 tyrosine-type recombinase/integrase [Rhodothermaceae bacterium]MYJ08387.1 tyrosine-type recombinase/integrase [Rhodothermaceae bacterium]
MYQLPTLAAPDDQKEIASFLEAYHAPSTMARYRKDLEALSAWLEGRELTDQTLARYLAHRYNQGNAPTSCAMIISAVKAAAKLANRTHPVGPLTERTIVGIRRKGRTRGRGQAEGLKWEDTEKLIALASRKRTIHNIRNIAIIAVMSDALLRVGELILLRVEDVHEEKDGTGRIHIRYSKTDQEGEEAILYLGECTMSFLSSWISCSSITAGPIFRRIIGRDKVGESALSYSSIRRILRELTQQAGLEGRYTPHSLRVGSAQSLVKRGATIAEIQLAGRWKEPSMVAHYAKGILPGEGAVARLRYGDE